MKQIIRRVYDGLPRSLQYVFFNAYGLYQAHERFSKDFWELYKLLKENEKLSSNEIEIMQLNMLNALLNHAYDNVPYYKAAFDEKNLKPSDIKKVEDLQLLPILTKQIIRDNYHSLIAKNWNRRDMMVHSSGGTTGFPLNFYLPISLRWNFNYATLYRFYSWAGVEPGDKHITIAGRDITHKKPYYFINWAEKQFYLSSHYLLEALENRSVIKKIVNFSPKYINGHPSAVTQLADSIKKCGESIPIKAIITTSEQLFPDQRALIEDTFGCKIFDTYGMGEMVAMASECSQHNGYHLAPEYGIVEIVHNVEQNSGIGQIIGTSLQNYAMPFIRYETGDIGEIECNDCQCRNNFPKLKYIQGRIDDILINSRGEQVLPLRVRINLKTIGIGEFQLIQKGPNIYHFNLLEKTGANDVKRAVRILKDILGDCELIVNEDSTPIKTSWGKQKMIIRERQ